MRLELISIEETIIDCAKISHKVGLPRVANGARAGNVDHGGGGYQIVSGLEPGIAFANDEYALVDEVAKID